MLQETCAISSKTPLRYSPGVSRFSEDTEDVDQDD